MDLVGSVIVFVGAMFHNCTICPGTIIFFVPIQLNLLM